MSISNKKYIIFDLDGTLVDSFPTVINACKRVLKEFAPSVLSTEHFFDIYREKDIEQMFIDFAKIANLSLEDFRRKYDELYALDCVFGSSIIYQQYEILKEAKENGVGIIILTNKKQELAESVCKKMFGHHEIDFIIGRKNTQPIKPRHVIISRFQELGISCQKQCIRYYGDSESDYKTAKLLNVQFTNIKQLLI